MNQSTEITKRESTAAAAPRSNQDAETVLRPGVDILENSECITLMADMPGVSKERLQVRVDRDNLVIEGVAELDMPDGMQAVYADVRSTRYRRSFALSNELEMERIEANLKDGVLTIRIPKHAQLQPRKIEVQAS